MFTKSILVTALVSFFASSVLAAPTPESGLAKIKGPVVPLNETLYYAGKGNHQKRDWCSTEEPYTQADLQTLINDLYADGDIDYVPQLSSVSWHVGTARICVYNEYFYENTHVSHWEMGWALQYITGECCFSDNPQCSGGECQAHGDSGLAVNVVAKNSAYSC